MSLLPCPRVWKNNVAAYLGLEDRYGVGPRGSGEDHRRVPKGCVHQSRQMGLCSGLDISSTDCLGTPATSPEWTPLSRATIPRLQCTDSSTTHGIDPWW